MFEEAIRITVIGDKKKEKKLEKALNKSAYSLIEYHRQKFWDFRKEGLLCIIFYKFIFNLFKLRKAIKFGIIATFIKVFSIFFRKKKLRIKF